MAKNAQNFHFYLRTSKNPTVSTYINLVSLINGKRLKFYTEMDIPPCMWDKNLERCIVSNAQKDRQNREATKINNHLNWLEKECQTIYQNNYSFLNPTSDFDIIADFKKRLSLALKNKKRKEEEEIQKTKITPSSFFQTYIDSMPKKRNKNTNTFLDSGTITHHKTVLKRYRQFLESTRSTDDFSLFNEDFEDEFELWGFEEKEYSPNTVVASFSIMKVWLNDAEKKELITDKAFHEYKSKGTKSEHIYLTEKEIDKIFRLNFQDEEIKKQIDPQSKIEITRDLFVLSCWTGFRFTDLKHINTAAVWNMKTKKVSMLTHKTKTEVIIPMHRHVVSLYNKYGGKFPHPNDKTHSIRHLKRIGELANIDDEILVNKNRGGQIISSKVKKHDLIKNHTGRRSFATNLYKKGMSTIAIMKMTGHTTEENFMKYIKITLDENADLNRKYFRNNNSTGVNLLTISALRRSKTDFGSLRLANSEENM